MKTPLDRLREMRRAVPAMTPEQVREHNARARREIGRYFRGPVVATLSRLYQAGRLKDLADEPGWQEIEREWERADEGSPVPADVGHVKRLMRRFIEGRGGTIPPEPPAEPEEEPRAVRIRKGKQEVIILSTVLADWLVGGWQIVKPREEKKP